MKLSVMVGILLFVCTAEAQSQNWQVVFTNGDLYDEVSLERLSNDTLYFRHKTNFLDRGEIDSLARVVRFNRGAILPAMLIGSVGGGVIGYASKPIAREQASADIYSALFGVVVGGVAGYYIGNALEPDDVYELRSMTGEKRREVLRGLLN